MTYKEECKREAYIWLGFLRKGSPYYEHHEDLLKQMLKGAGITLEDIGSSPAEHSSFVTKGAKASVAHHVWYLRSKTLNAIGRSICRSKIEKELKIAHLTLGDVGCTEAELATLYKFVCS